MQVRDDTRSAIVEAATQILREQGARGVTTRAVSQAAGVQAPTIYRLFGDKEGLIDAVAEHVMASYVAAKSQAATDDDPVADLRVGWQAHVEFGLANPGLYALLNAPGRVSPATATGIEVLRRRVHRLATAGLLRVDEARATDMIHAAGSGTVLALLQTPAEARDPGLADAMFEAVATRILTTAPSTADTGTTAVAVTFQTALPDLPALTEAERALMAEWLTRSLTEMRGGWEVNHIRGRPR
ncbi:TetR/AcrR family transcriptional regulator [Actinoplanes sp. LDG1-06]|uniref:TetR/AcrR family transcriptional regulator n=1 Tax=Paractinoplanes ovalisporus TaxID=2810368 RepID=A0ABS2A837_9ACTN|nr:TetR/AcrR family transcriptional regulator [Actinoplanes ovalisporus]MBM2615985.1 TetR/AcrR family transcriptional regulator [Actinoplanes ovalisporus]